jgi:GR25 family glycosyltransferase involved in LPS biosynthesis
MKGKAYVITITSLAQSRDAAKRCIQSGLEAGVRVVPVKAFTPEDDPKHMFEVGGLDPKGFHNNTYSRLEPCMATFMSHHTLWCECYHLDEPMLILEHDAVFVSPLPELRDDDMLVNLGKPSYGKFKTPKEGFSRLTSKKYLPGAHGYYVTPGGAAELIEKSEHEAQPTDIYLNLERFPFITEFYPWPIECDDSFSTIQKEKGCKAKHNKVEPI